MPVTINHITVDCQDPVRQATFWAEALGWDVAPGADADVAAIGGPRRPPGTPGWLFFAVPEPKTAKNRMHVDLRTAELEAEVPEDGIAVHDIPLLTENDRAGDFDAVIVVDVPEDVQVARMVRDRGWSTDDARSRVAAQADREQRRAVATHLIDNTGTHDDLRERVTEVVSELVSPGA